MPLSIWNKHLVITSSFLQSCWFYNPLVNQYLTNLTFWWSNSHHKVCAISSSTINQDAFFSKSDSPTNPVTKAWGAYLFNSLRPGDKICQWTGPRHITDLGQGLPAFRCQFITWTNDDCHLGPKKNNFGEILFKHLFFMKMHFAILAIFG